MKQGDEIQLSRLFKDNSQKTLMAEIPKLFGYHYSKTFLSRLKKYSSLVQDLFSGNFPGYQACNTQYHDFDHTLDALLATARLIDGHNLVHDPLDEPLVLRLVLATLLHDSGYIQEDSDTEGTGAKYTSNHVERSIIFLYRHFDIFDIQISEADSISRLIRCTGVNLNIASIDFSSEEERLAGTFLGTADLLGQMSSRTYLEKLLFLYFEFREANIPGFNTEFDILRKTLDFYEITKKKFDDTYMSSYRHARTHFKARFECDRNLYIEAIEKNIDYIHKIIENESTNFRQKLKRGPWLQESSTASGSVQ